MKFTTAADDDDDGDDDDEGDNDDDFSIEMKVICIYVRKFACWCSISQLSQ